MNTDESELVAWLRAEVRKLRDAVRLHHDQRGDDRCHLDDLKLYHDALGIVPDPYVTALPPDAEMEESCRRYIRQRQHPDVRGSFRCMTIAQLQAEVARLQAEVAWLKRDRAKLVAAVRQADEFLAEVVAYGLARQEKGEIRKAFREALAGLDAAPAEEGGEV